MSAIEQQVHAAPPVAAEQSAAHPGERTGEDLCQFVICRIGSEEFAVDVLSVQEINRIAEVTRVPKTLLMWRESSTCAAGLFRCSTYVSCLV